MRSFEEINRRHLDDVRTKFPGDEDRARRLSIIDENGERYVRMAHLAALGSHAINGVAALHTELLKTNVLRDFYELTPEKFSNKTNGVTPRRWMVLSNPRLAHLLSDRLGHSWIHDLEKLRKLESMTNDPELAREWRAIKHHSKQRLAAYIHHAVGVTVDPDSMFDVLVKRLHEYKRQHLKVLHILTLYKRIQHDPGIAMQPRTFIFGGKAAPGYRIAKLIIKLIHSVAAVIHGDPLVRDRLRVVFLPNYNVKLGQRVYPAADLSEQISLAGKEASGTGNMKFAMNGALTIGTLDGANIEIREEVGAENFFLFGLTAQEVEQKKAEGYNPRAYYESNPHLREILDSLSSGEFSHGDRSLFEPLLQSLLTHDEYMLLADYQSYIDCQDACGPCLSKTPITGPACPSSTWPASASSPLTAPSATTAPKSGRPGPSRSTSSVPSPHPTHGTPASAPPPRSTSPSSWRTRSAPLSSPGRACRRSTSRDHGHSNVLGQPVGKSDVVPIEVPRAEIRHGVVRALGRVRLKVQRLEGRHNQRPPRGVITRELLVVRLRQLQRGHASGLQRHRRADGREVVHRAQWPLSTAPARTRSPDASPSRRRSCRIPLW